jgi:hypothetical protein
MSTDLASSSPLPITKMPENTSQKLGNSGHIRAFSDTALSTAPLLSHSAALTRSVPPSSQNGEKCGTLGKRKKRKSFNLSVLQVEAIGHALRGTRDSRIADILGIDRKTLWNWKMFNRDYRNALAVARDMLRSMAINQYQTTLAHATSVLEEYLNDSDHNRRFRAAQTVLQMAAIMKPDPLPPQEPRRRPKKKNYKRSAINHRDAHPSPEGGRTRGVTDGCLRP